jgi:hypothetical protein
VLLAVGGEDGLDVLVGKEREGGREEGRGERIRKTYAHMNVRSTGKERHNATAFQGPLPSLPPFLPTRVPTCASKWMLLR